MTTPISVLHLEDNSRDAMLIRDLLESDGTDCRITCVATGREFEMALQRERFDIVLTDNNLPDYNGTAAIRAVRQVQPLTPVIVISGSLGEYEAVKCLQLGATDYLLKGRMERFVPAFRRALTEAHERLASESAKAELKANEERMRLALTATNDAIWDWDLKVGHMICNDTFKRLFGWDAEAANPEGWWYSRTHPDDRDAMKAGVATAIAHGDEFWAGSYRMLRVDGTWAHVQNRVCLAKDEVGAVSRLVGAVQDITAHVVAESERRNLGEQLRQAQKMEAIGTLAGGIAHDFNNILGIILANADLSKRDAQDMLPEAGAIVQGLDEILLAADRARHLVRQILTFSRRTSGERTLMKTQSIVRECVRLLRTTIPSMITIEDRIDPRASCILGDPTQVHQVVMNICTNAWHAVSEKGGRIEVSVTECQPGREVLQANPELDTGTYVRVSIADNGHGMDPKTLSRIFEPFFTTKGSGKGSGLGLAVVHGIVKAHGGAIVVRSERGAGTTFDVYFPAETDAAPASEESITDVGPTGWGQRIIIVDEDASMARAIQHFLKRSGYAAQVFHHPELALEVLRGAPQDVDLVLTDYAMPRMSGIDLAGRVLQLRPDMPVILLSGSMELEDTKRAQLTAFKSVLAKPVSPTVLLRAIAEALPHEADRGSRVV